MREHTFPERVLVGGLNPCYPVQVSARAGIHEISAVIDAIQTSLRDPAHKRIPCLRRLDQDISSLGRGLFLFVAAELIYILFHNKETHMANKFETIEAAVRNEFGKGSARRARMAGNVPAVIYGAALENNLHVTVDHRDFAGLVRRNGVNAVMELDIEGDKQLVMIKHIDQNVLTFNIDHLDLLAITRGEKVEVEIPVIVEGQPAPNTMFVQDADTIRVEADALNIPEELIVSIEGMELGSQITAGDIKLEADMTLIDDAELLIANVVLPAVEEAPAEDEDGESEGESEA